MNLPIDKLYPSPLDARDIIASSPFEGELPSHVDLLPDVEEVENQFQSGSCTANAAASALEIAYKRAGRSKDFSRLYNYWFSRKMGNIVGDKGAYPRDVCKALNKHGICLEETWQFDLTKNLEVEPSQEAQEEAKQYPVFEYARLTSDDIVTEIKKTVASGIPVMTSIKISNKFTGLESDWKTHDWDPRIDFIGAHQVLIIGYNDESQRFLALNSWGNRWGDGGFFGIPYSKMGTDYYFESKIGYEYWILSKLDVPYSNASGLETDPYNIREEEIEESDKVGKMILAILIISVIAFGIMMM